MVMPVNPSGPQTETVAGDAGGDEVEAPEKPEIPLSVSSAHFPIAVGLFSRSKCRAKKFLLRIARAKSLRARRVPFTRIHALLMAPAIIRLPLDPP